MLPYFVVPTYFGWVTQGGRTPEHRSICPFKKTRPRTGMSVNENGIFGCNCEMLYNYYITFLK